MSCRSSQLGTLPMVFVGRKVLLASFAKMRPCSLSKPFFQSFSPSSTNQTGIENCLPRLPADHDELDLAVAGEAVFESVFRAWHVAPTCC